MPRASTFTDADLAVAAADGDMIAFGEIYDRYADRIHGFSMGMLRDRAEAEDAMHDTFVIAAQRLSQLRDPSSLKAWLYAIARNESLRRSRARGRMIPTQDVPEMAGSGDAIDVEFEADSDSAQLAQLVWDAAEGLDERDKLLMELSVRHGLEGAELASAAGVSVDHAYVMVHRMRERVERSLGALLIARLGRDECTDLDGVLKGWDGTFSVLVRKRVARHIDSCAICKSRKGKLASPLGLLAAFPITPASAALRERVLDSVASHLGGTGGPGTPESGKTGPIDYGFDASGFPKSPLSMQWQPMRKIGEPFGRRWKLAILLVLALLLGFLFASLTSPDGGLTDTDEKLGKGVAEKSQPDEMTSTSRPDASTTSVVTATHGLASPLTSPLVGGGASGASGQAAAGPILEVSTSKIDFGPQLSALDITITNVGEGFLDWTASASSSPPLEVTAKAGSLAPRQSFVVGITLTRAGLQEGSLAEYIVFNSNGGDRQVAVVAQFGNPPEIVMFELRSSQFYQGDSYCSPVTTQASAQVTDESAIASVTLHYRQQDGTEGSSSMTLSGVYYVGTVGPIIAPGVLEVWIVVTDVHGFATTSPSIPAFIIECPIIG